MSVMSGTGQTYVRRALRPSRECVVFLSSGSDLLEERDCFEEMVKIVDEQIHWAEWRQDRVHIRVVRWEQDAAHRAGGDPNAAFRAQAASAHLTVVLLHDDIRPGTKEELEAALLEPDVQIAVVWMEPTHPRRRATVALRRYLEGKKDVVIWSSTGAPGSRAATLAMMRVVARIVADLGRPTESVDPTAELPEMHYDAI